jgi:hypothetical protein
MTKKPVSIVVVDEPNGRYVVSTSADGEVMKKLVDPKAKPRRRPRKPYAKATTDLLDKTRKKRF